jgi:hypothetical protein
MAECFSFHGLTVEVTSPSAALVEEIRRDFTFFRVPATEAQVRVEMRMTPPPWEGLPAIPATVFTPRNVCFQNRRITYIDYFGRGLAVFDRRKRQCLVYGTDADLVHEITYLFILSVVGKYLDSQGIHRVHALGVSYCGQGLLLLLPSGGGKSTMALELDEPSGVSRGGVLCVTAGLLAVAMAATQAPAVVLFLDRGDAPDGVRGGPLGNSNPVVEAYPTGSASLHLWAVPDADDDKVMASLGHDLSTTGAAASSVSLVQHTLDNTCPLN